MRVGRPPNHRPDSPSLQRPRPRGTCTTERSQLQRERSLGGGCQVRRLGLNAVIELAHQIAAPTPGIQGVCNIAQVGTSVAMESDRTKPMTDALAFAFLRFLSALRSREHHRLRCRATLPLIPAWNVRGAVARRERSWCADRSASPSSCALSAYRSRRGPVPGVNPMLKDPRVLPGSEMG